MSRGVALHGLRKSFRTQAGTVEAVRGIDVSVARGETVAVLGPNGTGRSEPLSYMVGIVAFATPAGDDGHDPVGLVPFPMTFRGDVRHRPVQAAWSALLIVLAARAYLLDTKRV